MNLTAHRTAGRALTATVLAAAFFILGREAGWADHAERMAPCVSEDSTGEIAPCYWDASVRGNGKGQSFVKLPDGSIYYRGEG